MKKNFYTVVIAVMLFASCNTPNDQVIIKGDIAGLDSVTLFLKIRNDKKWVNLDSAVVKNGHFTLKGNISEPQLAYIATETSEIMPPYPVFIEPGKINVKGDMETSDLNVTGSTSHEEMKMLNTNLEKLETQYGMLIDSYYAALEGMDMLAVGQIESELEALEREMTISKKQYVENHPGSHISLYVIMNDLVYESSLEDLEHYRNILDVVLLHTTSGRDLEQRIETLQRVATGQIAPGISLQDTSGQVRNLSDMRGNYVLVDFWASWCRPCRKENPHVVAAYQEFHDKGFDIFAVSLDSDKSRWMQAIYADSLTWTHVIDNGWQGETPKTYGVISIPSNFLLDPDGRIIAHNLFGDELSGKLDELLN